MRRSPFSPVAVPGAVLFSALGLALAAGGAPATATADVPIVFTQVRPPPAGAVKGADPFERRGFEESRLVVLANGALTPLTPGFSAACDPSVALDGRKLLFAGKKTAADPWRIWECDVDGANLRPVTPEGMEARSPLHVSTLFTLDSPQPWFTLLFVARQSGRSETGQPWFWSLYNIKLDGTEPRRLTYNPGHSYDPVQMWDGRVVHSSERLFPSRGGERRVALFAVHIEGADSELYGGEKGESIQHMACSLARDRMVFVEAEADAWDGAGQLAFVTEARPHVTYERLTKAPGTLYLYPAPWKAGSVLVSKRSARQGTAGLCVFDLHTGKTQPLFDSQQYHNVQARRLEERPRPDGHSTVVEGNTNYGTLYGLNCYDAAPEMAAQLKPGEIKRVRLIEGMVQPGDAPFEKGTLMVPRRLVGEAPVESDGSFNLVAPSDTPMQIQTLDERGMALATSGWIWLKSKETRGCIGCHEDPERIPENEYVQALRRPSTQLVLPPEQRRLLTFKEHIAPMLAQHCATAQCHGGKASRLRLPATSGTWAEAQMQQAFAALVPEKGQGYVQPGKARLSPMLWQLVSTNTTRPWDLAAGKRLPKASNLEHKVPPGKSELLPATDLTTLVQWIDMGAQYTAPAPTAVRTNLAKLP